jgi:hypothetical protein
MTLQDTFAFLIDAALVLLKVNLTVPDAVLPTIDFAASLVTVKAEPATINSVMGAAMERPHSSSLALAP